MGKSIAVIPARGGSKRIPSKNIIEFCGKPLIAHTIEAAIAANKFERIIVSTESPEIAKIATAAGAEVPFLRSAPADDQSGVELATLEVVNKIASGPDKNYEYVAQLLPTCPLRSAATITSAFEFFEKHSAKSIISCFGYGFSNPWWALTLDKNYVANLLFKNKILDRSQDTPQLFCPSGAVWMARVDTLVKFETFYIDGFLGFPINWSEAIDIDDYQDLELAKLIFELRSKK